MTTPKSPAPPSLREAGVITNEARANIERAAEEAYFEGWRDREARLGRLLNSRASMGAAWADSNAKAELEELLAALSAAPTRLVGGEGNQGLSGLSGIETAASPQAVRPAGSEPSRLGGAL